MVDDHEQYQDPDAEQAADDAAAKQPAERVYRDARTGEYVTAEYARKHPDTTVSESDG